MTLEWGCWALSPATFCLFGGSPFGHDAIKGNATYEYILLFNTKHITHIVFGERNQKQELLLLNVIYKYNTELPKCMESLKYVPISTACRVKRSFGIVRYFILFSNILDSNIIEKCSSYSYLNEKK